METEVGAREESLVVAKKETPDQHDAGGAGHEPFSPPRPHTLPVSLPPTPIFAASSAHALGHVPELKPMPASTTARDTWPTSAANQSPGLAPSAPTPRSSLPMTARTHRVETAGIRGGAQTARAAETRVVSSVFQATPLVTSILLPRAHKNNVSRLASPRMVAPLQRTGLKPPRSLGRHLSLSFDDVDGIRSSSPPQASRHPSFFARTNSIKSDRTLTARLAITHSTQSIKADTGAGKWDTGRAGEREPVVLGRKKEEFEHLESIIRNEKKIQRQHKKDQFEQEYDPRKECLRSYADMCVRMRMPCQPSLRLPDEPKKKHPTEEEEVEIQDQYHGKKIHRGLEVARREPFLSCRLPRQTELNEGTNSAAKIHAISQALVDTLRTKHVPPPKKASWREKYDNHGNPLGVPWWQVSEETFEDLVSPRKFRAQ